MVVQFGSVVAARGAPCYQIWGHRRMGVWPPTLPGQTGAAGGADAAHPKSAVPQQIAVQLLLRTHKRRVVNVQWFGKRRFPTDTIDSCHHGQLQLEEFVQSADLPSCQHDHPYIVKEYGINTLLI